MNGEISSGLRPEQPVTMQHADAEIRKSKLYCEVTHEDL
jgi:hypothetical protein